MNPHVGRPDTWGSDFRARKRRREIVRREGWSEAPRPDAMTEADWALYYQLARNEFGWGPPMRRNGVRMLPRDVVFV